MEEQLIEYETAKLAKEKGFDELCSFSYNLAGNLYQHKNRGVEKSYQGIYTTQRNSNFRSLKSSAPTQSLLQKWLREKYDIHVVIDHTDNSREYSFGYCIITGNDRDYNDIECMDSAKRSYSKDKYKTYEEALEEGLIQALNLIK